MEAVKGDLPVNLYRTLNYDSGSVRTVRFNEDGNYCMTGGSDKVVRLWNPFKAILLKSYCGHGQEILDVVSSKDNSVIASASRDRTAMVWDVVSGKSIRTIREHKTFVSCLTFGGYNESSLLLTGSNDMTAKLWDLRTRTNIPIISLEQSKDSIMCVQIKDEYIMTGSVDTYVRIYDVRKGMLTEDSMGYPILCCKFSFDKKSYLALTNHGTLQLIDVNNGLQLNKFCGHKPTDLRIEADFYMKSSYIISGDSSGKIHIWDILSNQTNNEGCQPIKSISRAHKSVIHSVVVNKSQNSLITSSQDSVCLWINNSLSNELMNTL